MAISGTILLQLLPCLAFMELCASYNIDISHARVLSGPKDSLFGYTSVFTKHPEGYKLLVGAPKSNTVIRNETGATYRCDIDSFECTPEYITRQPPEVSFSGTPYNGQEMYGSFITQTVNDTLVVCAPRYKDLTFEDRFFSFLIGRCVMDNRDKVRPLFGRGSDYVRNVEYSPGIYRTIYWNGMGQSGISGDSLADGSILLGIPGFMEWRGGVTLLKSMSYITKIFQTDINVPEYSFIGYSVVAGNFCGKGILCFAAGGPRKETGQVFVYLYTPNVERITILQTLRGDQTGSYFGASLCSADVNGDGIDDLLVGAPFYTDVDDDNDNSKKIFVDEGRVTVFLNLRTSPSSGLRFEKRTVLKGSNEHNARFGTAITNIGDVNKDGYEDVAVGAPYEDEGRGVVYIYHGSNGGLMPEVKQRIMGRDISNTMMSFGWSISKPADVDNNKYPDFSVGSYLSDKAVILRTRPVVSVQATMETDPQLIIRDPSLCPAGFRSEGCFRLKICFFYTGESLPRLLRFHYTLTVDTFIARDQKRVQLNSTQGLTDTVSANVTASSVTGACHEYQAMSIDDRRDRDPFTVVRLEATYQLQQPADPDSDIQPVSNQEESNKIVKDIAFQLACGEDNQCWSDLVLEAKSRTINDDDDIIRPELYDDIVINSTKTVTLDVAVRNEGEDAFATVIYVVWTGSVTFQTSEAALEQPVICNEVSQGLAFNTRMAKCNVILPVKAGSEFGVIVIFNAESISTDRSTVDFTVTIETGSNETNPLDNVANVTAEVWIDAETGIDGKSDPEQVVISRTDRAQTVVKMEHKYVITNRGPSFLPPTDITVKLPYYMKGSGNDQETLVQNAVVTLLQEDAVAIECLSGPEREGLTQNKTTTQAPETTTSGTGDQSTIFLPPILPSKLVDGPENIVQDGDNKVFIMDCQDYGCEEFLCSLQHLSPGGSVIVNVNVDIPARNLPFDERQDVDYLKYQSTGTVKKPSHPLLYPWDGPVIKDVYTLIYPEVPPAQVNIWIIIGSVVGGIVLLTLLFLILYKLGFFKREKKGKIQKWKRESAYYKQTEPRGHRKSEAPKELATPEEEEKLS